MEKNDNIVTEKKKIIYDLVHGYIEIDKDVEEIINSESFQRLKHISQLTAQHLFPSANHTRFEHSLGVMKLAIDSYIQLEGELKDWLNNSPTPIYKKILNEYPATILEGELKKWLDKCPTAILEGELKKWLDNFLTTHYKEKQKKYFDSLLFHLKYAALLHDIGHGPLSHVGEYLYDKDEILGKIKELFPHDENKIPLAKNASPHELMSCYVILKKYQKTLSDLANKNEIDLDIEFICRIISGAQYSGRDHWDRNLLISLINGKIFDVDKMDYLLRDNHMTGNVGGYIDSQRLLCSLRIVNKQTISFNISALSSLKKLVDCRDSLYMWVYNHHIVVYTDYLYSKCLSHFMSRNKEECLEAVERADLFSCEAIAEKNVSDDEVYSHIRKVINLVKQDKIENPVTKELITQLLGRKFFKASWKTLFEYKKFLEEFPPFIRKIIPTYFQDDDNLKKIQLYIEKELRIKEYEWAVVKRNNKFYNDLIQDLYIYKDYKEDKEKIHELGKLLPVRDYSQIYENVAFYIFAPEEKIEKIKQYFTKYFNESIYLDELEKLENELEELKKNSSE